MSMNNHPILILFSDPNRIRKIYVTQLQALHTSTVITSTVNLYLQWFFLIYRFFSQKIRKKH